MAADEHLGIPFKNPTEVLKQLFLVAQAQEKLGPVDMLVNCAGMSFSGKFEELEVDSFKVGNKDR